MNPTEALRYLAHEANRCRRGDRDTAEAICLLLPALCRVFNLKPLDDFAALEFHLALREELQRLESVPLVEAHCSGCGNAEAIRADLFAAGPARSFCDFCQRESAFDRTTPAVALSPGA